jgi:hypothetical protein
MTSRSHSEPQSQLQTGAIQIVSQPADERIGAGEEIDLEAEAASREFWSTRFCRKYGTFGSEPRGKVTRQAKGVRVDDGYAQWGYARGWKQKDSSLNATNPRVALAQTFGVLLKLPGPGEHANVGQGFESSSRFGASYKFTVKGKSAPSNKVASAKMPVELLVTGGDAGEKFVKKKHRKTVINTNVELSGTRISGKPIEYLSVEQLREEIKKYGQIPGPNSYPNADAPYSQCRVGRNERWNCQAPRVKLHPSKPTLDSEGDLSAGAGRELVNFHNMLIPLKETKSVPGPGAYDLAGTTGKDAVSAPISPLPKLSMYSSKFQSPVGPGSYDIIGAFEKSSRMSKVAKAYQQADMRRGSRR